MNNPEQYGRTSPDSHEAETIQREKLFDLAAMTDDEIIVTHRAITELANAGLRAGEIFDAVSVADSLGAYLGRQLTKLGMRAPERVSAILVRCLDSGLTSDGELVAHAAAGIVHSNYQLARDVLISFLTRPEFEDSTEVAGWIIADMMRESMTAQQIKDFNQRYLAAGGDVPFEPSRVRDDPTPDHPS